MDYLKTRCPICLNRFCCVVHRDAHLKENHPESLKRKSQEYLVKSFQRKAERIIINAQKYKAHNTKSIEQQTQNAVNSNSNKTKPAMKRLHSDMNRQIVSTKSIIMVSKTRKILVPSHRSQSKSSSHEIDHKPKSLIEMRKSSPCDVTVVKTSTPIIKNQLVEGTPQEHSWNISQTSSISSYHTPSDFGNDRKRTMSIYETPSNYEGHSRPEEQISFKNQLHWTKNSLSSPRSIMSKISKYSNEVDPSPNTNIPKCRRVTFSFGSSTSSPLESVQEVEVCNDIEDECIFETDGKLKNDVETRKFAKECINEINKLTEVFSPEDTDKPACNRPHEVMNEFGADSSPENTKSGFFNCVTNMICSAVPLFTSWRGFRNDQENRLKRSRSPDTKHVGVEVSRSPEHKRLCYPFDLRNNPIKARKPISNK